MGKMTHYVLILVGTYMLFFLFGFIKSTNSFIVSLLDISNIFSNLGMVKAIAALVLVGGTAAVIVGLTLSGNLEGAATAAYVAFLIGLGADFIFLVQELLKMGSLMAVFALIIFVPLLYIYSVIIIEFWKGRD